MGSMKVTANLAMRARDVSRPRPEHLAEAEARENAVPRRFPTTARNDAEIQRVAGVKASSGAEGRGPSRPARPRRRRGAR